VRRENYCCRRRNDSGSAIQFRDPFGGSEALIQDMTTDIII